MAFRNAQTLEGWLEEFAGLGYPFSGDARVITQDGDDGADTGLISVRLGDADTSVYIQPRSHDSHEWVITLESRDEALTLDPAALSRLAAELHTVSTLCTFLELKSSKAGEGDRP